MVAYYSMLLELRPRVSTCLVRLVAILQGPGSLGLAPCMVVHVVVVVHVDLHVRLRGGLQRKSSTDGRIPPCMIVTNDGSPLLGKMGTLTLGVVPNANSVADSTSSNFLKRTPAYGLLVSGLITRAFASSQFVKTPGPPVFPVSTA